MAFLSTMKKRNPRSLESVKIVWRALPVDENKNLLFARVLNKDTFNNLMDDLKLEMLDPSDNNIFGKIQSALGVKIWCAFGYSLLF